MNRVKMISMRQRVIMMTKDSKNDKNCNTDEGNYEVGENQQDGETYECGNQEDGETYGEK